MAGSFPILPPAGCLVAIAIAAILGVWKFIELMVWLSQHVSWTP